MHWMQGKEKKWYHYVYQNLLAKQLLSAFSFTNASWRVWNAYLVWCAGWTSCGFLRSDQKNRMRSNSGSMSATLSLQPSGNIRNKPPCSCNIYQAHTGKNFKSPLNIIIYWKNKHVCCIGYLVILYQLQIDSPPLPPLQMVT